MSNFKYHKNNKSRYNVYEDNTNTFEVKSLYLRLRNSLVFVTFILSLILISLIFLNTYSNQNSQTLIINQLAKYPVDTKITKLELTNIISNTIVHKINTESSLQHISHHQLKLIIKNIMKKINNSSTQIIYTQR